MEEVDERAFLFEGKHGTNAYHFTLGAPRIYEDFFRAPYQLKRPSGLLGIERFFGDLLLEGGELPRGDDCCGVTAALDLALVGALEGGADGDDPMGTQHLQLEVCIVGDGHELRVAWTSQDGVEGFGEPDHLEGEGLSPVVGLIPKGNGQIVTP